MTTQELKQQIEKVLGNSIRCLLPSYWWKRLFNQVADRIDEVEQAVSNVTITTDDALSETSTNAIQNQAVAKALVTKQEKLVDGVNVKTINGKSILGSGNLALDADFTFVVAFDSSLNDTTTTSEKSANKTNASLYYQNIQNEIKPKVALKFSFRDSSSEVPVEVVPSFVGMVGMYNVKYQSSYGANAMVFAKLDIGDRFAGLTFDLIMDPDIGSVLVPHIDASEINILHARVVDNAVTSDGLSSLCIKQNQELYKYALSVPVAVYVSNTQQLIPARVSQGSGFLAVYAGDYVFEFYEDGTIVDHPIQKDEVATVEYVNEEVAKKVDKVEGKQLTTEDFTTALKTKLEGLNNYDDTELSEAVARLRDDFDSLTQEDISAAIENFNEIISFLDGIEDSESLDSIIASIEQQVANKQDKIDDLDTIRSGAALGATALQEHQDISHLATKEEVTNLQNEVLANEEVVAASLNDLNTRIEEIAENVGGAAATKEELAEAIEGVNATITEKETVTNEAIAGVSTSVETLRSDVAETYATKEDLEGTNESLANLTNEILTNEEVVATAFNDVNDRLNAISENVSGTTVTKGEFETTVTTLNESIATKADATSTSEAITGLQTSVSELNTSLGNYATTEALNTEITNITNEIITNEEITAAAFADLNTRLLEVVSRLDALENN